MEVNDNITEMVTESKYHKRSQPIKTYNRKKKGKMKKKNIWGRRNQNTLVNKQTAMILALKVNELAFKVAIIR